MKLLPWMFAALFIIAIVAFWSGTLRGHTHHDSDSFNPLAPSSPSSRVTRQQNTTEQKHAPALLESDAAQLLTAEIRGLRQDLRARSEPDRQPLGDDLLLEELRKIASLLQNQAAMSAPRSELRSISSAPAKNAPLLLDLWSNLEADYHSEEDEMQNRTIRRHLLRSEASILAEFGVPDSVNVKGSRPGVWWQYDFKSDGGDAVSITIQFLDGRVSRIEN